jgi:uncharacterized protein YndB with AHSA1/START domain
MTTTTTDTTITIDRVFAAPIQRVYDAWVKPELMAQWYCPNPAWELKTESEPVAGGAWVVTMGPHVVRGNYLELDEPSLIVFTWSWDQAGATPSQVRVELSEVEDGTRLVLVHSGLTDATDVANHLEGWEGCFVRLPDALA